MKISITAIFFCICSISNGQSRNINKIIDSLKKRNIDTIIHYQQKCSMLFGDFQEYLLWRQDSGTKIMTYTSSNIEKKKPQFKVRLSTNDTVFSYLKIYSEKIKDEQIIPIVCKLKIGDSTVYSPMDHLHPCTISLLINCKSLSMQYQCQQEDIEEKFMESPNLNYPFNSSTHLFRLIKLIQTEVN